MSLGHKWALGGGGALSGGGVASTLARNAGGVASVVMVVGVLRSVAGTTGDFVLEFLDFSLLEEGPVAFDGDALLDADGFELSLVECRVLLDVGELIALGDGAGAELRSLFSSACSGTVSSGTLTRASMGLPLRLTLMND